MGAGAAVMCIAMAIMAIALQLSSATYCDRKIIIPSQNNDGFITSPGYPHQYSPNICKMWVYYGRPGMQIDIRFLDVHISSQPYDSCPYDYLKIGPFAEKIYCGNIDIKSFEPYTAQMTESSDILWIVFKTGDYGTQDKGFKIYYQFSDTFSTSTTSVPSTVSVDRSGIDINSCHFVFNERTGEITTNQTVLACLQRYNKVTWLIHYQGLGNLDVRYEIIKNQCSLPYLDTLKVYNGLTSTDDILASYSESQCPTYLISSWNGLFITYTSAGTGDMPTLILQFAMIEVSHADSTEPSISIPKENPRAPPAENPVYENSDLCNFVFSNNSGEINSDYLYSAIQKSGFCTWLLHSQSAEGQKVTFELTLRRFQLSSDSIFNVYDGANTSAEVIGRLVSLTHSVHLKSSQNNMFIYYNPGRNFHSVGLSEVFTINYGKVVTCADRYLLCGYGELSCYKRESRCDGTWHCPKHGGDERGCPGNCPSNFNCGFRGMGCYTENERCNGKGICPNNIDEQDCDEEHCSSSKGLFLCSNLRCVYETLRCDQKNDCLDNSDEDGCYSSPSTRIILEAVVCTLVCALVLVIAMGCACKFYRYRVRRLYGLPRHESPLSRQLSEMLHHRAPPPPYHEAMLTSRPYSEAYSELLGQTEHQSESSGAFNNGYQENDDLNPLRQQSQSNNLHGSRTSCDNLIPGALNENQNPSARRRTEFSRLVEVDTLSLSSERVENGMLQEATNGIDATSSSDLPPYSETDTSLLTGSYLEDAWHRGFENVASADNDIFNVDFDGQSLIQMDMISSNSVQVPVSDQAPTFSISSNGVRSVPSSYHFGCNEDDSDKDALSASTSLSFDSSRMELVEEREEDKMQEDVDIIDDDSDSDCILAGNEAYDEDDDDDSSSDAACILDQL